MPARSSERTSVKRRASSASATGVRLTADLRGLIAAGAGDDEAARHDRCRPAASARSRTRRSAATRRPRASRSSRTLAVDDDLIARADLEHVVEHDVVHRQARRPRRHARRGHAGALTTASRSSVRFARSSWTMPMRVLAITTPPKRASLSGPDDQDDDEQRRRRRKLKRVKTLALTISATVRVGASGTSLRNPRATRSATSAEVSPCRTSIEVTVATVRRSSGAPGGLPES